MNIRARKTSSDGLTRINVSFVVGAISLLLFFFLVVPCTLVGLGNSYQRSRRISCTSNLKQVGLAMRLFANDHDGKFPWMISTNLGGSLEFTNSSPVFRHFLAASNELVTPKVLVCGSDSDRERVGDFAQFSNRNLSYFISLDAVLGETNPAPVILSGDRNILGGATNRSGLRVVRRTDKLAWSKKIHERAGNLGLADGSVLQADDSRLNSTVAAMTNASIRLAMP